MTLTDVKIEIVEVPFEDGSLPGYFVHAQNPKSKRAPCVVFFDGLDVTKEIQYMRGVPDLIKRGISVLVMDGPGHRRGDPLPRIHSRARLWKSAAPRMRSTTSRNALGRRPEESPSSLSNLGGYYAPRCAAMEPRFAACIAWGAIWDYYATWKRRIDAEFKTSLSVPGHHIMWILGVDSYAAALKKLEPFRLDGVVQKDALPVPDHAWRRRRAGSARRCAGALRCRGIQRQDAARLHRRRRRRAALPARLPDARCRRDVELARGQAGADLKWPVHNTIKRNE